MYTLSRNSLKHLNGVDQRLVKIATRAIEITTIDFGISDGLRTIEEQAALVTAGASKTMKSKHLEGKAIDVFAYLNGKARWEAYFYYSICEAFIVAANEINVGLRWGGAWHIDNICSSSLNPKEASLEYIKIRTDEGKQPFLDFPHFEL